MLEALEARQLVQGIPIAVTVLVGQPLIWSEDNNIAVVTQLGTYIFELNFSPDETTPCIMFCRYFIPSPAQPSPHLDTEILVNNILQRVDRTVCHSVMLDSFLSAGERAKNEVDPRTIRNFSPAMPGGDPCHRGYCRGSWSPYGMGLQGRCLLALVTYDHKVIIMGREGHKWLELLDISAIWYKRVSHEFWKLVPLPSDAPVHETHIARLQMLGISEIIWTPTFVDNEQMISILIMITISGHAVFWKIPSECSDPSEIQLLSIEETKMKLVSAIYWLPKEDKSGYLALGSSNGQAKIFYCKFTEEFSMRDLGYAHANIDRISVNHLKLMHIHDKQHLLLLGKQSYLLAVLLTLNENELTLQCTAHRPLGRLPISGIVCLENNNVYVSIKDGNIQHVSLRIEEDQMLIDHIGTPFRSEGVAYVGLVTSPHCTLWAILESVSVAYDHLIVREPTQISIYQVGSGTKIFQYLKECQSPLHLNVDLLESLRLHTCKSGKCCVKIITAKQIDRMSDYHLKLHYWLTRMCRSVGASFINEIEDLDIIINLLQKVILEQWINATIRKYSTIDIPEVPSLILSLSLMCFWIMNNGKGKEKSAATHLSKKLDRKWKEECPICQDSVSMNSLISGTCKVGHTLPRCCRSFLLTKPIVMCPSCKTFTHKIAADMQNEKVATCVFCDGRLTQLVRRD